MSLFDNITKAISNPLGAITGLFSNNSQGGSSAPAPQSTLNTINAATGFNYSLPGSSGGGASAPPASGGTPPDPFAAANQRIADLQAENARLAAAPRPANVDYLGISSKARQQAEANVNPLYQSKLDTFLAQYQQQQGRLQQDKATTDKLIAQGLADTQTANKLTGERTAQDVATNLGVIGDQAQNFQTTEGTGFDQARTALQQGLAESGLTGSGLGNQQENAAITSRNRSSAQTVKSFNTQEEAQKLLQTRTFEDIGKSNEVATRGAGQASEKANIDLNRALEDAANNLDAERKQVEADRQLAIIQQSPTYAKNLFQQFLSTISNPGVRAATAQSYGGLF